MKLTMTHRGRGSTAALAEGQDIASCPRHLNRDGTLSIALPGIGGHVYTLSARREEWQDLFLAAEDLYGAPELLDEAATNGLDGTMTGIFADPTPRLSAEVRADMWAAALDLFRKTGACALAQLVELYGFTVHQVSWCGEDVINQARAQWEREGGPSGEAARKRATA